MSEQLPPHSLRTSLVREYWNASLVAGIIGAFITLGALKILHLLAGRGIIVFDNVLILGTVLCGFLANAALLKIFVSQRLIGPFARMLRDLNSYLGNTKTPHGIDITTNNELGAVARRCEDLMQQIITQQHELEEVNERFQAMIVRISEAKEAAEQADLAKTQFMARMSHEIRTPINGVLGMIELLMDSELTESQARLARIIRDSGKTLLGIIDGLLDFAKLEVDKIVLETTPFDLYQLTEDVVSLVAPTAHAKNLEIAYCIDPNLPQQVIGDPFRLRQVLINLLGNAIKFTAEGEIAIDVAFAHGKVNFAISDTGVGIPADVQEVIFEPFEQASVQVSRQFGGTGLGLSIARQLVQLMGGNLTVASTVNVGSTFQFSIDLSASPTTTATPPTDTLENRRILLIENSQASARAISTRLIALGAQVIWVTDITDGLERLRQGQSSGKPFEAAIAADQTGGLEFLKRLQGNPLFSSVRVILAAPLNRIATLEKLPETAQTPLLIKPLRSDNLDTIIHKIKSGRPLNRRKTVVQSSPTTLPVASDEAMVLVAEDNPVNAEVASRMLTGAGYHVDVAKNGIEAVHAARQTLYNLILMDGQMPEMDGVEAAKAIRKHYQDLPKPCPPPPIIAVTADAFDNARSRYIRDGMDDFIAKPFNRTELLALVARWIRPDIKTSVTQSDYTDEQGKTPVAPAPAARQALSVIDRATLTQVAAVGGEEDQGFLKHIIEIYCRDMSESLQNIHAALQQHDGDAVRKIAHKMKSSSANLGAKRLATLSARIEKNQIPENADVFKTLKNEYTRAAQELRAILAGDAA
jgi:signal transduction histidine kinase/CheY-like chemotaxis protein